MGKTEPRWSRTESPESPGSPAPLLEKVRREKCRLHDAVLISFPGERPTSCCTPYVFSFFSFDSVCLSFSLPVTHTFSLYGYILAHISVNSLSLTLCIRFREPGLQQVGRGFFARRVRPRRRVVRASGRNAAIPGHGNRSGRLGSIARRQRRRTGGRRGAPVV